MEVLFFGAIPANTGKIRSRGHHNPYRPGHPREYGENHIIGSDRPHYQGSSPRIRGE